MPVDIRFQAPFIPQEGITSQILTAIQLANEQSFRNRQLAMQQQAQPSEIELRQAQAGEAQARAGDFGVEAQLNQQKLDMMKKAQGLFNQPMQPGQEPQGAKWLPQGTPSQLAPMVAPMIPDNLTDQEKAVIEGGAQSGRMKATQQGDVYGYLNDIRAGVDSVVNARNAAAKPEGERALGSDNVNQLNQGIAQRWQVMNPGKQVPQAFVLKPGATQKDFDRIDKLMEGSEKAAQTKSQNQANLDIRQQLLDLQKQNFSRKNQDFIDKTYVEPANQVEKSYQMFLDAYNNRNDAKTGAESMLALSTHLNTTFGNVKGARVTKDMIQEHLGARSVSDSALVAMQKLTNGDVLSQDQWDAFKNLITQSRNLSWQTVQKEAKRRDVDVSGSVPTDVKGGSRQQSAGGLSDAAKAYLQSQGVTVP